MIRIRILILSGLNSMTGNFFKILVCISLLLTSCGGFSVSVEKNVEWEKSKMYEVRDCTMEGNCFFQYPSSANLVEKDGRVIISNDECDVYFGVATPERRGIYAIKISDSDGKNSESWLLENILIGYFVVAGDSNYKFWVYEGGDDMSECVGFVDQIADSFTDRPTYYNERFSFTTAILPNFRVEYLQDENGVVMKRTVAGEELKKIVDAEWEYWPTGTKTLPDENPYDVEIGITVMENLLGYEDLGAYLKAECSDCTLEFYGNGVFVGEDKRNFSERVYLMMSDDKKHLYRAYLRIPSPRYKYHVKGFDEWVKTIEIF